MNRALLVLLLLLSFILGLLLLLIFILLGLLPKLVVSRLPIPLLIFILPMLLPSQVVLPQCRLEPQVTRITIPYCAI